MTNTNQPSLSFIELKALPKIELHVHLDCCLSFNAVTQLNPGITIDQYRRNFIAPNRCKDLFHFLTIIDSSLDLLQTENGLQVAVQDLFEQFSEDNVIYAEIRFAPLLHLRNKMSPEKVVEIVEKAVSQCVQSTGIKANIILCTLRHFSKEQSLMTAQLVEQFKNTHVVALDLAADEAGFPLDAHIASFDFASKHGIFLTAHAGEARGPESVRETLELLHPSRIGHGVRSVYDLQLLEKLKEHHIHLEVCPSCNVQIGIFDSYMEHPIDTLFKSGISLSINTDTRTITGISLTEEYQRLHQVFNWTEEHFFTCNRNALEATFLPEEKKNALRQPLY